jgi:Putative collagen-binding domain of a collagenase
MRSTIPFLTAWDLPRLYVNAKMDLVKATLQWSLSSTGFCFADSAATGAEYLVFAPNGGTFTVNLSATPRVLNVEWFYPDTGATSSGGSITGGPSTQSFTAPFCGDCGAPYRGRC